MAAAAGYRVHGDAIHTEARLNPAGTGIEDVHVVPYTITSGPAQGQQGTVKVPAAQFSPAAVKAAVEDRVNTMHAVAQLGQG